MSYKSKGLPEFQYDPQFHRFHNEITRFIKHLLVVSLVVIWIGSSILAAYIIPVSSELKLVCGAVAAIVLVYLGGKFVDWCLPHRFSVRRKLKYSPSFQRFTYQWYAKRKRL